MPLVSQKDAGGNAGDGGGSEIHSTGCPEVQSPQPWQCLYRSPQVQRLHQSRHSFPALSCAQTSQSVHSGVWSSHVQALHQWRHAWPTTRICAKDRKLKECIGSPQAVAVLTSLRTVAGAHLQTDQDARRAAPGRERGGRERCSAGQRMQKVVGALVREYTPVKTTSMSGLVVLAVLATSPIENVVPQGRDARRRRFSRANT